MNRWKHSLKFEELHERSELDSALVFVCFLQSKFEALDVSYAPARTESITVRSCPGDLKLA